MNGLLCTVVFLASIGSASFQLAAWTSFGANCFNDRHVRHSLISHANIGAVTIKWTFSTPGGVTSTPTLDVDGRMYVPDWSGMFWCINVTTGEPVWSVNVSSVLSSFGVSTNYSQYIKFVSRTSAAIGDDSVFIGSQAGAMLMSFSKSTGALSWARQTDPHIAAVITGAPIVYEGVVYVGVASVEEYLAVNYTCCNFIGSFAAYNATDGRRLWSTPMLPPNNGKKDGYAGASVWGSSPPIDAKRRLVYVASANAYRYPKAVDDCFASQPDPDKLDTSIDEHVCLEPGNFASSVVALDLDTGEVRWNRAFGPLSAWVAACGGTVSVSPNPTNCPGRTGLDLDFAQEPILVRGSARTPRQKDVLVVGQKSGIIWAVDPDSGAVLWSSLVAPFGLSGGLVFGSASDGENVYYASANSRQQNQTLLSGEVIRWGSWGAVRLRDGKRLWDVSVPDHDPKGIGPSGAVTVANGVVYALSRYYKGGFFAFNASNGNTLLHHNFGRPYFTSAAGVAIQNGMVYVPAGLKTGGGCVYAIDVAEHHAIAFNETAAAFRLNASLAGSGNESLTWSMWVQWRGPASDHDQFLLFDGLPRVNGFGAFLKRNSSRVSVVYTKASSASSWYSLPADEWVYLSLVLDRRPGSWTIFEDSIVRGHVALHEPALPSGPSFAVGGTGHSALHSFLGQISDVAVWRMARSAEQLKADMTAIFTGHEPNLRLFLPFSEGHGSATAAVGPFSTHVFLTANKPVIWTDRKRAGSKSAIGTGDEGVVEEEDFTVLDWQLLPAITGPAATFRERLARWQLPTGQWNLMEYQTLLTVSCVILIVALVLRKVHRTFFHTAHPP